MTVFFRDANIRSVLMSSLESTFGLDPELKDVPAEYAFALVAGTPMAVAETFFKPWLTDFIRMACVDFESRTEAERVEVVQRTRDGQSENNNVLEVFLKFCFDSYKGYSKNGFTIPPSLFNSYKENSKVQISEVIFKNFNSLADDLGALYSKEETEFSVGSLAFGAVYCLSDFLCTALIGDSSSVPSYPEDGFSLLERFTPIFNFYADAFRSYQSFVAV